jgi:acetyltransferase EpsM
MAIDMDIIGASGHGKVIVDILRSNRTEISGIWDDNQQLLEFMGYSIKGNVDDCVKTGHICLIIAIGKNSIRKKIADKFKMATFGKAIHPSAVVSSDVLIGEGSVAMANSTINIGTTIGKHVIINTNASVDHDCVVGDFVHISPQAGIAGDVLIGEGTHIGIGANVIQGIKIGKWCTIGAGSVIIQNIPDGTTVVGNPGRIIRG